MNLKQKRDRFDELGLRYPPHPSILFSRKSIPYIAKLVLIIHREVADELSTLIHSVRPSLTDKCIDPFMFPYREMLPYGALEWFSIMNVCYLASISHPVLYRMASFFLMARSISGRPKPPLALGLRSSFLVLWLPTFLPWRHIAPRVSYFSVFFSSIRQTYPQKRGNYYDRLKLD